MKYKSIKLILLRVHQELLTSHDSWPYNAERIYYPHPEDTAEYTLFNCSHWGLYCSEVKVFVDDSNIAHSDIQDLFCGPQISFPGTRTKPGTINSRSLSFVVHRLCIIWYKTSYIVRSNTRGLPKLRHELITGKRLIDPMEYDIPKQIARPVVVSCKIFLY